VIWDNDVSGCRFQEWTSIWFYQIYHCYNDNIHNIQYKGDGMCECHCCYGISVSYMIKDMFRFPYSQRVKQELLTFPEQLRSPPVAREVRVARSIVRCVVFCRSLFILFVLFLLIIVLSVLFWFITSDYPFSIVKLSLFLTYFEYISLNYSRGWYTLVSSIFSLCNIKMTYRDNYIMCDRANDFFNKHLSRWDQKYSMYLVILR
jgi:hypothetical protein